MKNKLYRRIFCVSLLCIVLFSLTACTTAGDVEEGSEGASVHNQGMFAFDKSEPQYYMSKNSAASEKGYYYITGEPVSIGGVMYLYFYDIAEGNQYPVCSKATCEHNDATCDAHTILENTISNTLWYYEDRLYMVERTQEYDRIISYDLSGRDRQNHTILTVDGHSVFQMSKSKPMCFNDGYVYYISGNAATPSLYRVSIAAGSEPELIKTYDNSAMGLPTFTLSALPDRVYINFSTESYDTSVSSYFLDYYDIPSQKLVEAYETDSEKNSEILDWNQEILFDKVGNMYYAAVTETEYIINRLNIPTMKTEKFYSIECNNTPASGGFGSSTDADFTYLCNFDGTYFYIYKAVHGLSDVKNFRETTINYGIEHPKTMMTEVNTNYLFVVNEKGRCVDLFPFKETDLKETVSRQQGMLLPAFVCGDSRELLIGFRGDGSTKIEGLELTEEKYLNRIQEYLANKQYDYGVSTQVAYRKAYFDREDTDTWYNLSNKLYRVGF